MVQFMPGKTREQIAQRYMDVIVEKCGEHYLTHFRPPSAVRVGIRVWADLLWHVSTIVRFMPPAHLVAHDDYYCAYCGAILPKRHPGARCGQCGAPWCSREQSKNVDEHKTVIGATSMDLATAGGIVTVQCDSSLAGEAIVVDT